MFKTLCAVRTHQKLYQYRSHYIPAASRSVSACRTDRTYGTNKSTTIYTPILITHYERQYTPSTSYCSLLCNTSSSGVRDFSSTSETTASNNQLNTETTTTTSTQTDSNTVKDSDTISVDMSTDDTVKLQNARNYNWISPPHPNQLPKSTYQYYLEYFTICIIFAVTGSSAVYLVRPIISHVTGLSGSLIDGPNSYRVLYIILLSPSYYVVLYVMSRLFNRRKFFDPMIAKMWGRILPKYMSRRLFSHAYIEKTK